MQIIVYRRALRPGFWEPPANGEGVGIARGQAQTQKFVEYLGKKSMKIKTKSLQIRAKKMPNVLDLRNIRPTFLTS